jgi:DNA-binding HxlR family transcriptional regulator
MALLDILGQRWTLRILWELREGPVGFRDLAVRADSMSQSVLNRRLKELEAARLVMSDDKGWGLSREGARLLELLLPLSDFARKWAVLIARSDTNADGIPHRQNRLNRGGADEPH